MKKMYKGVSILLVLLMALSLLAGCGNAGGSAAGAQDVAMQYMTADETEAVLNTAGYTVVDVRKAADYEEAHIAGSVSVDMDAAVNGDAAAGEAAMKAAFDGKSDTLILVCYSGKKYAQASTNALSAIGYDMNKVFTLEGGFNGWKESKSDLIASGAEVPASATTPEAAAEGAARELANQSGTVTTTVDMSKYAAGKTVRVWIPVAHSNEYQTVDHVVFDAGSAKAQLREDAVGNTMVYVEWGSDAAPADRIAHVSFHASRDEIARPELKENGAVGSDMDAYLGSSEMVAIDGEIKTLADEITADETTVLGKARAIYDWVIANMNRDNDVRGCGIGDVRTLIHSKAGKCTDINSTFVALCRASGIPAREMFGIRMNADDITGNQHCWAQFYLPGTGWVGADPADVLKAVLTNSWDKESDETKELQEYYWGGVDEKRVELSRGRDLVLSPAQDGEPLNDFGYPYAEVDGEVIDCWAPSDFVYSISFISDADATAPAEVARRTVYVTPEWLNSALEGKQPGYEDVVVICVAYPGTTEVYTAYGEGHIPGALYASIMEVEDATGSEEGAYNLLSAEEVRDYLLGHGITKDTKVVLYGPDVCGVARQAYAYIWCGVEDVKVLNGGLEAWTAAGYATEAEEHTADAAGDFGVAVPAHPEYWVSLTEAKDRTASDDNFKLVSIRSEGEWLGETSGYSYMDKAGEPEGAVWGRGADTAADVNEFCDFAGDAILVKDLSGLKEVWKDCDFNLDNMLAFYCGTGWRACVPFLVLYENGYDNIAVFDGGWYEWLFHDDYPVQVGDPASPDCVHTTVGDLETGRAAA